MDLENMKTKSFWERPEGTTGMVVGAAVLASLGLGLWVVLPILLNMMVNTVALVGMGLVLSGLLYVVFDKQPRTLIWYMYKSLMRKITGVFIEIDPIGILKSYADSLREKQSEMTQHVSELRGQMRSLQNVIQTNEQKKNDALGMAQAAKKRQEEGVFSLKARQVGRLNDSNRTLQGVYSKMELLYRALTKMAQTSGLLVEDIESEIEVKSREQSAINASYSAFKSAMSIMRGDPDKKEIFDQTMEFLTEDYGRKLGEIEDFVSVSANVVSSIDLKNGIYEESALKQLEAWEKRSDSILGPAKQELIALSDDSGQVLDLTPQEGEMIPAKSVRTDYKNLFKKVN